MITQNILIMVIQTLADLQTNWNLVKGETILFAGTYAECKAYETDMRKRMAERGTGLNMFEYVKAGYRIVNNNF